MSTKTAQTDHERRFATYLGLMAACVDDLVVGYVELIGMVARGAGAPHGGGGRSTDAVAAPIRIGVVDAAAAVERVVEQHVPLVRGALRLGLNADAATSRHRRTVDGLRFLGASLRAVYETDPDTGDRLTDALWDARRDVTQYTGEGTRPYRLEDPCEACGQHAVWVNPTSISARCTACGNTAAWSVSQLVHVTVSAQPQQQPRRAMLST